MSSDHLLTLDAAAERLLVDRKTVRRWVSQGRLRAFRLGPRVLRVKSADVEALLTPIPTVKAS